MLDERRADLVAVAGKIGERPRWDAGFEQNLDQPKADTGRLLGWFEEHAVARDERGADHPRRDRQREVPGRDDDADAARLMAVDVPLSGHLQHGCAHRQPQRFAPVVLAEVDRLADVRIGFFLWLACLEDFERGELGAAAAHHVRGAEEHAGSRRPWRGAPGRKRSARGLEGPLHFCEPRASAPADDRFDGTRIDRDDLPRRAHGSRIDEHGRMEAEARRRGGDGGAEARPSAGTPELGVRLVRKWAGVRRIRRRARWRIRRLGQPIDDRRSDELLQSLSFGEPLPDERFVRRVLQETADEVRHAGDEIAHRRVDAHAKSEPAKRSVHRLRHSVEKLMLDGRVGQAARPRAGDPVGDAAHVVAAERGSHAPGLLHQVAHAALVVGVGLGFGLEDRDGPPFGVGRHGLGIPVRPLHEPDDERHARGVTCPCADGLEIRPRILPIRLDHAPELRTVGELSAERAQELERQVLHVVVLHVEVNHGPRRARPRQNWTQALARLAKPFARRHRAEERRERGRLDRHVHPRDHTPRVPLETFVERPARRLGHQRREHRLDALGIACGVPFGDGLLAENVDRARFARAPETRQSWERVSGRPAGDQLPRHAHDVPAYGRGGDPRAQRHASCHLETEAEHPRHVDLVEVLDEVAQHVGVVATGGQDVDEPEELRLEAGVRHRPVEDAFAPASEVEDSSALGRTRFGDPACEVLHVPLARRGHAPSLHPSLALSWGTSRSSRRCRSRRFGLPRACAGRSRSAISTGRGWSLR